MFLGSKYPKNVPFNFEKNFTAAHHLCNRVHTTVWTSVFVLANVVQPMYKFVRPSTQICHA